MKKQKLRMNPFYKGAIGSKKPIFEFVKNSIVDISSLRDKPRFVDYINLAFSLKDNYDESFKVSDPFSYFSDKKWEAITIQPSNGCSDICDTIISSVNPNDIVTFYESNSGGESAQKTTIDGIEFGWIKIDNKYERLYVSSKHKNSYQSLIKKLFWRQHKYNGIILDINTNDGLVNLSDDYDRNISLHSAKAVTCADSIKKFIDKQFGRSILFYGPPGSGKSFLVRQIAIILGFRTFRINKISLISCSYLVGMIELTDPEIIIIEDIDSINVDELSDFLHKIEKINSGGKIILGTVNKILELDNALVRPGRFDEAVEIKSLDKNVIMSMINNDLEVYEIVKDYPVAFIAEISKRINVLGKEHTLKNMVDINQRVNNLNRESYSLEDD